MHSNLNKTKSKINLDDIKKIVLKLQNFYDRNEVLNWSKSSIESINSAFEKYNVSKFKVNEKSYMGIVIDCTCNNGSSLYIKVVPPMINRFETEVDTLKLLPDILTCELYEIDYNNKIIIMEKIVPGKEIEFYDNKELILKTFKKLYKSRIKCNIESEIKHKDFLDVVTHDYNICKKNKLNNKLVDYLYNTFCDKYLEISKNRKKYILHGDVYKNNLLKSENGAKVIDPLGFIAPYVFELLPICSYEMFYNDRDNVLILNDFMDFFKSFASKKIYVDGLFCQLVKLYIPSLYEANDGGFRAQKWLDIIGELYPQLLKGEFYE